MKRELTVERIGRTIHGQGLILSADLGGDMFDVIFVPMTEGEIRTHAPELLLTKYDVSVNEGGFFITLAQGSDRPRDDAAILFSGSRKIRFLAPFTTLMNVNFSWGE